MVKSYLRHGPTESFGVVASSSSNSLFDGRRAYVPALEDVLVWDVKKGEQVREALPNHRHQANLPNQTAMWHETGLRSLVTCLARSPVDWDAFAVGYADGSIRIWSAATKEVTVTFNGHKSAISALAWDADGTRLASGSKDTDIIVWDVVGEVGMFRLRGHRDQITGLAFISAEREGEDDEATTSSETKTPGTHLLSSSKDTFIKLFSLSTQHCVETVVGHRGEAWSFAYDRDSGVLISGGGEGEVKCWKVDGEVLTKGVIAEANGKLRRAIRPIAALSLPSTSHTHNITQITLHPTLPVLAVHSGEKTIDVFRLRTEEELRKKMARRRRREREKKKEKNGKGKGKEVEEVEEDETMEEADGKIEWRDRLAVWSVVRATGKIRSFAFAPETAKSKGDVQVRPFFHSSSVTDAFIIPDPRSAREQLPRSLLPPPSSLLQIPRRRTHPPVHPRHPRPSLRRPHPVPLFRRRPAREREQRKPQDLERQDDQMRSDDGVRLRHLQHLPSRRSPCRLASFFLFPRNLLTTLLADRRRHQVGRTPPLRPVLLLSPRDLRRAHRTHLVSPRPS